MAARAGAEADSPVARLAREVSVSAKRLRVAGRRAQRVGAAAKELRAELTGLQQQAGDKGADSLRDAEAALVRMLGALRLLSTEKPSASDAEPEEAEGRSSSTSARSAVAKELRLVLDVFTVARVAATLDEAECSLAETLEAFRLDHGNQLHERLGDLRQMLQAEQKAGAEADAEADAALLATSLERVVRIVSEDGAPAALADTAAAASAAQDALAKALESGSNPLAALAFSAAAPLPAPLQRIERVAAEAVRVATTGNSTGLTVDRDKELALGTFGAVFEGKLGVTTVTVKLAAADDAGDGEGAASSSEGSLHLMRELTAARTWKKVEHRNVLQPSALCVLDPPQLAIILPNCDLTLDALLHERGQELTSTQQETVLKGMARGLAYLHEHKVLHGNVCPVNVVLSYNMRSNVKLTDVGMAADPEPAYAAPELLDAGVERTASADVFSLAVTVWEMIEMQRPWAGVPSGDVGGLVQAGKRPEFGADAPWKDRMRNLVQSGWASSPASRPSADAVLAEVEPKVRDRRSTRVIQNALSFLRRSLRHGAAAGGSGDAAGAGAEGAGADAAADATPSRRNEDDADSTAFKVGDRVKMVKKPHEVDWSNCPGEGRLGFEASSWAAHPDFYIQEMAHGFFTTKKWPALWAPLEAAAKIDKVALQMDPSGPVVGDLIRMIADPSNVNWDGCPGGRLGFFVGYTAENSPDFRIHEIRGTFFCTDRWRNLWAPLSAAAVRSPPQPDLLSGIGNGGIELRVGMRVHMVVTHDRVDWTDCPGTHLSFSTQGYGSHFENFRIQRISNGFFTTETFSSLWAPLAAAAPFVPP